jgi:hypothetical protein
MAGDKGRLDGEPNALALQRDPARAELRARRRDAHVQVGGRPHGSSDSASLSQQGREDSNLQLPVLETPDFWLGYVRPAVCATVRTTDPQPTSKEET